MKPKGKQQQLEAIPESDHTWRWVFKEVIKVK